MKKKSSEKGQSKKGLPGKGLPGKGLSEYRIIVAIVLIFFILKFMLPFLLSDDANMYWYLGKLVSEGQVPYRDFRIGHPPLMFFISAFFFKIFGASLMVGRLVPALSGVGILLLTYLLGEKAKKGLGNLAAAFLFLSPHFQMLTNSMIGASLNLVFLLASLYMLVEKRDALAGVFFVLAGLARYSAFPMFLVILGYVAWKKRWKFAYGVGAMLPIAVWVLLIPNFFEHTVVNMFARNVLQSPKMTGLAYFFFTQKWVVLMGVGGAYLAFYSKKKSELLQVLAVVCASTVLILLLPEIRYWYLYYSLPFFCILGAYAIKHLLKEVPNKWGKWVFLGIVGLVLFWSFALVLDYRDSAIVEEILAPKITPGMGVYDLSGTRGAYMAMKHGTRIPPGLVDNNGIALASGVANAGDIVQILENSMPAYLIDYREDERTTYWATTEIRGFVENNYMPFAEGAEENTGNVLVIWERR